MRGSYRWARIAETDLAVHWSLLLLLGWSGYQSVSRLGWASGLLHFGFVLSVFGCILLHEFGHAWAARSCGIVTHSITMLPIGGLAQLERMPREPRQECLIAAAGPAVNLLIAGLLMPFSMVLSCSATVGATAQVGLHFADRLAEVNLCLAAFNLLPAFPMDGGRMLRAYWARRTDYVRATRRARLAGCLVAAMLAVVGVWLNPMLVVIAVFVVWAGGAEMRIVEREAERSPSWRSEPAAVGSSYHRPHSGGLVIGHQLVITVRNRGSSTG